MLTSFTIPEKLQSLGFPWNKKHSWMAGNRMQKCYEVQTGSPPLKELRPKTNPNRKGTHMIAVYPAEFEPLAEAICRAVHTEVGV